MCSTFQFSHNCILTGQTVYTTTPPRRTPGQDTGQISTGHLHTLLYRELQHGSKTTLQGERRGEFFTIAHDVQSRLIWWDSTTVLPVLRGTIGQDGQGFLRAVVAVLHGTIGIDTIGYSKYSMGKDRHRIDQYSGTHM